MDIKTIIIYLNTDTLILFYIYGNKEGRNNMKNQIQKNRIAVLSFYSSTKNKNF